MRTKDIQRASNMLTEAYELLHDIAAERDEYEEERPEGWADTVAGEKYIQDTATIQTAAHEIETLEGQIYEIVNP